MDVTGDSVQSLTEGKVKNISVFSALKVSVDVVEKYWEYYYFPSWAADVLRTSLVRITGERNHSA